MKFGNLIIAVAHKHKEMFNAKYCTKTIYSLLAEYAQVLMRV